MKVLHGHVLGGYHLLSHAESLEPRAQDVGTSIATVLGSLCLGKVDTGGCQLLYQPSVDASSVRLTEIEAVSSFMRCPASGPGQGRQHRQGPTRGWWIPTGR